MSVRAVLSGLTVRGRCLAGAGGSAALCGMALGQRDLVRAGVLLIAIPLVCALVVGRARVTIEGSRTASTARATVGDPIEVTLRITNGSLLPVAGLMLEDRLPPAAGRARGAPDDQRARFALGVLRAGHSSEISYPVPSLPRGRFALGPMRVRLSDPFGMVELVRTFSATSEVAVLPRIEDLPRVALPGGHEELGGSAIHSLGSLGADDLTVREYRQGDDLRKIHWRSSARTGELMVRQEERPWQGEVTVLVDTRRSQHRGEGAASSFEWMVAAAASIAEHLAGRGYRVTIAGGAFASEWPASGGAEALADLRLGTDTLVGTGADAQLTGAPSSGATTLIALLGMPGEGIRAVDAQALQDVAAAVRIVIGVKTDTWAPGIDSLGRSVGNGGRAGRSNSNAAARPDDRTLDDLGHDGWRTAQAVRGQAIQQVWATALSTATTPGTVGGRVAAR
jgi:uncharacterized protein (DUF58 family)